MKAALNEIVTAERPYHMIPSMPLRTSKRGAIIFKFDVNFKYDLREKNVAVSNAEYADLAIKAFELSQSLCERWTCSDFAAKRQILEIICLNFKLDGVTLCP